MNKYTLIAGAVVLVIIATLAYIMSTNQTPVAEVPVEAPLTTVQYACAGGKTITAAFYAGSSTPATDPNMPPTPGGTVELVLNGGATTTLAQTISADGARYANVDESFVFWSKGNGAFITEHDQQTYSGCVMVVDDPGGLPQVYVDGARGFSIRYPDGFTVNDAYTYQELGQGKDISGVSFTIPASLAQGTNLGADTYISVEEIPSKQTCDASMFLSRGSLAGTATTTFADAGVEYSMASSTGAGAGNRYEETIYARPDMNSCIAVRYFIHYGVIENYPAGAVHAFDQQSLLALFDRIRRSMVLSD